MSKSTSTKVKRKQKKSLKDTQKKDTKSKCVKLKGNEKNDYIIIVQDGKSYFDLPITHEELYELYCILENKFGEFIGYKIK